MSSTSFIRLKKAGVARAPDGLDGYTSVFPWRKRRSTRSRLNLA